MSIDIGTEMPDFELRNQEGTLWSSSAVKGKKAAVVYFYPKNFTPQCTKETCSFRDAYQDFVDANVAVIGISGDSVASHKKFAKHLNVPFTLLADSDKEVRKLFKVKAEIFGLIPGRETFVFDKKGLLVAKFSALNAAPHIAGALKTLRKLN